MALRRHSTSLVLAAGTLSLLVAVCFRFRDGVPMGVDSSSHLFKVLFAYKTFCVDGYFPSWCSEWYGGTAFLLSYPPLAYGISFLFSIMTKDPVLSYKVLDAVFYAIGPIAIAYLINHLGFTKGEAAISAVLFAFSPIVIENYLFFDRFNTTISIPLLCLFLVALFKFLHSGRFRDLVAASTLTAGLILIHHLTTYLAGIIAMILVLGSLFWSNYAKSIVKRFTLVFIVALGLTSFWLIPFARFSSNLLANSFRNETVNFNFIQAEQLIKVATGLGLFQLTCALLEVIHLIHKSLRHPLCIFDKVRLMMPVILLSSGSILSSEAVNISQYLVASGFGILTLSLIFAMKQSSRSSMEKVMALWFVVFLWLGLGFYAILYRMLPFYEQLDVLRFQLYLIVPMSILASSFLSRVYRNLTRSDKYSTRYFSHIKALHTQYLLVILLISSTVLAFSSNAVGPVRTTETIPNEVIRYFAEQTNMGRILPIRCPEWIYVLPYYTGKPLIDGWYPQEKLLEPLLQIDDYSINTLKLHPEEQISIWNSLLGNASQLGIQWVMIGDPDLNFIMEPHQDFLKAGNIDMMTIYVAREPVSLVEVDPASEVDEVRLNILSSGKFQLLLTDVKSNVEVTLKEAYLQGWHAQIAGTDIALVRDEIGFITFEVAAGDHIVQVSFEETEYMGWMISVLTVTIVTLYPLSRSLKRRLTCQRAPRMAHP